MNTIEKLLPPTPVVAILAFSLFLCAPALAQDPDASPLPDAALQGLIEHLDAGGGPETVVVAQAAAEADVGVDGPGLVFRPLTEVRPDKPLTEANEILVSVMDVIDFRDTELQDVLRIIAAKSRLNIIMAPEGVSGKVTLHLENVRLGVALNHILRTNDLAYVVEPEENIVRIVNASDVGFEQVETRTEVIQINWVNAERLSTTLRPFLSTNGDLIANSETNALIVIGCRGRSATRCRSSAKASNWPPGSRLSRTANSSRSWPTHGS